MKGSAHARATPRRALVFAERATRVAIGYLAVLVLFGVPLLLLRAAATERSGLALLAAIALGGAALVAISLGSRHLLRCAAAYWAAFPCSGSRWFWTWLALGLCLRLAWIAAFPSTPASDGATYLDLATRLATGREYEMEGTRAYWPPGYPLWLAPWIAALGDARLAVIASNLALFGIACLGCWRAAGELAGPAGARLALPVLALWPNYVAYAGSPEKEPLLIALLPWVVLFTYRAAVRSRAAAYWAGAGAIIGLAALVQPSLQLLPLALLVFALLVAPRPRVAITGVSLAILATALVIAPWAWRNYAVLGAVVPISSSGGSNLYRANNPLATGGYIARGEVDLSPLPEVEADQEGRRLALQWITRNPIGFARLAVWKQVSFAGDDAAAVYIALRIGRGTESERVYAFWKLAANAYWVVFWSAMLAFLWQLRRRDPDKPAAPLLPSLVVLYLFAVHSVFESAGKYHVPLIGVLPVLLATYAGAAFRARGVPPEPDQL